MKKPKIASLVAAIIIVSGCNSPEPTVENPLDGPEDEVTCSEDELCVGDSRYSVSDAGEVTYSPGATGLPFKRIYEFASRQAQKDEFETTEQQQDRISGFPAILAEQLGAKLVLRMDRPYFRYDADTASVLAVDASPSMHSLENEYIRGFTRDFRVASQACSQVNSFEMPVAQAQELLEGLRNERLGAFYVGEFDPDYASVPTGFSQVAPGIFIDAIWMDNAAYGRVQYRTILIAMDLERLDFVDLVDGDIVHSVECAT